MSDDPDLCIQTHLFDVSHLPASERFKAWTEHNRGSVFTQTGEGPFDVSARIWLLDGIVLSEHRLDAFIGWRDQKMATVAGLDHIMLVMPLEGTTRVKGAGVHVLCEPGDIAILDYRKAMSTINSRQHGIAVNVRRTMLEARCGPVDLHGRLPRTAETHILAGHLRSVVPHLSSTKRSAVPALSRILCDLIAMALPPVSTANRSSADRPGLREQISRYVASVPPGTLSVTALLRDVGTTRATLYRAFHADGGLLAYDRNRRLGLVHRALIDKDLRSLTEMAADFGFGDPAGLARQFRRRYGYSMTQLRQLLAIPSVPPRSEDTACIYRDAVRSLTNDAGDERASGRS